jgi:hypothetical protein
VAKEFAMNVIEARVESDKEKNIGKQQVNMGAAADVKPAVKAEPPPPPTEAKLPVTVSNGTSSAIASANQS